MSQIFDRRGAGILLHPASLPGKGPIGDFGIEAFRFIDFLSEAGQSFWQILPLNQIDGGKAYSPYSPLSAFAGNVFFIATERVVHRTFHRRRKRIPRWQSKIDYHAAEKLKYDALDALYDNFSAYANEEERNRFQQFCVNEHYWLYDYALFIVLKNYFGGKPWNEWPEKYRDRKREALAKFVVEHNREIEKQKYFQFLFINQWLKLKKYANDKGIRVFGDVPIYTSYDSADVWAHPHYFLLNADKSMQKVAGVPPDYFNADGQLWNMPVYNWEALRKKGYEWWLERLRKNLQLYDVVRLDHFRAFSAYWEIEAGAPNARTGAWKPGPSHEFFNTLQHHFPHMPFAAEDLGDIDEAVYRLRDDFELPGMCVLQFGFGDDFPHGIHLPHNHRENSIVYTGTHDNNTTRGWFTGDTDSQVRKRIRKYLGGFVYGLNLSHRMIRLSYQSVGRVVIVPMQDILNLGGRARMNFPSTVRGNWDWRLPAGALSTTKARWLKKLAEIYGRFHQT